MALSGDPEFNVTGAQLPQSFGHLVHAPRRLEFKRRLRVSLRALADSYHATLHFATIFTSLSGTTIIFTIFLPSSRA